MIFFLLQYFPYVSKGSKSLTEQHQSQVERRRLELRRIIDIIMFIVKVFLTDEETKALLTLEDVKKTMVTS